jgi:calcium-independent phospholipase A2-gamma
LFPKYSRADIICGTSTGGIISMLLGVKRQKIEDAVLLYDSLIDKIFVKPSRIRLVSERATYDATDWEVILDQLCGDEILLDSHRHPCARTFCVSTNMNINPPLPQIWRNYNYPLGQKPRYPGSFRVKTKTAVRATSAAPTFFTPIQLDGGLFCDGALVANNPSVIAVQEAKTMFPNVPIEFVLSVGTGTFIENKNVNSMDWGLLVNQLIASSTNTEDVHTMLNDLLPEDQYYRLNPFLDDSFAIDEMNPALLLNLKAIAKSYVAELEKTDPVRMGRLIKALSGTAK